MQKSPEKLRAQKFSNPATKPAAILIAALKTPLTHC
jgi:hypothetical protein